MSARAVHPMMVAIADGTFPVPGEHYGRLALIAYTYDMAGRYTFLDYTSWELTILNSRDIDKELNRWLGICWNVDDHEFKTDIEKALHIKTMCTEFIQGRTNLDDMYNLDYLNRLQASLEDGHDIIQSGKYAQLDEHWWGKCDTFLPIGQDWDFDCEAINPTMAIPSRLPHVDAQSHDVPVSTYGDSY